uniref:Uncharacterized protein n=1 Tax=Eutreptiella gymnastica TaxID=73025 RepID=A0A7S1I725_9EUGL|mmetsp:Transcript_13522/g.24124  ORF Transcript_13522/g.24124 Transcript_13522/m.24124 type:complete len:135 (+) Transcript_13522:329-733(+)
MNHQGGTVSPAPGSWTRSFLDKGVGKVRTFSQSSTKIHALIPDFDYQAATLKRGISVHPDRWDATALAAQRMDTTEDPYQVPLAKGQRLMDRKRLHQRYHSLPDVHGCECFHVNVSALETFTGTCCPHNPSPKY